MEIVLLVETYWTWTPNSNFIAISMAKIVFPRSLQNRKTLNVGVSLYARSRPNYNRAARFEDNFSRALFHQLIREWFTSFNKKKKKAFALHPVDDVHTYYVLSLTYDLLFPLFLSLVPLLKSDTRTRSGIKAKRGETGSLTGLLKYRSVETEAGRRPIPRNNVDL